MQQAKTSFGPGMREFVALMAALMASNALAIDAMLPALPAIGEALDVGDANRRQLVITSYLLGFGFAQIVYGPLSDRFGRKSLLIVSMLFYAVFAVVAGIASSFTLLLGARMLQGAAAAGTRVLVVAVVRDRFEGSAMARIMSLVSIIFMIMPMLAPAFGQGVLEIASWRFIFIGLGVYGLVILLWTWMRLPETLRPEHRRALSVAKIGEAMWETLRIRASIGNTIALTLVMGGLFGFINSIQQIVSDVFGRPELLALTFAAIGVQLAAASYLNARIVMRFGSQRIMRWALRSFAAIAALHLVIAATFGETLPVFIVFQGLTMASFGLIAANLGAVAMAPLGHVAGTASSVQGLITTVGGAMIGFAIGQAFDGTVVPLLAGITICGLLAMAMVAWSNPGSRGEFHEVRSVQSKQARR